MSVSKDRHGGSALLRFFLPTNDLTENHAIRKSPFKSCDNDLVSHSQCSLRENPKFLQNFSPKNNTFNGKVWLLFSLNIYHCFLCLTFKNKKLLFHITNLCVLVRKKFPKLASEMRVSFANEAPESPDVAYWLRYFLLIFFYVTKTIFIPWK